MQRLRSTFSGNACLKEFDLRAHVASAGTCLLWRVHDATRRGRQEDVSVFIFDKKAINQDKSLDRKTKDRLFEIARRGASQLQKLRHPNVLRIVFPVTESKDMIAFATERVVASLSNLLGTFDNLPKVSLAIKEYELGELECCIGISQVCDALSFLHDHAQLIHGNVTPDAIVVTDDGSWKLWGFDFACHIKYQEPELGVEFPEFSDSQPRSSVARATQPTLDYLAPEYIVSRSREAASDVYSLAHVIFACFNRGRPILESDGNVLTFQSNVERISRMAASDLTSVPSGLQDLVKSMLNTHTSLRPIARDVPQHKALNTTPMLTLRFIATLHEKDNPTKAQFMKDLPKVLHMLPKRVVHQRVLPALQRECKQTVMAPFVLPNILHIADGCSIVEFEKDILPHLIPLFSVTDPVQVPAIFLNKLSVLLEKSPSKVVSQHILPMVYRCLDSKDQSIMGLCLQVLPSVMNTVEYAAMKNDLLPRIQRLVVKAKGPNLCINGLVCLGKLLPVMDKWIFQESMLPMLEHVKLRDPGVVMALLGVLHQALRDKDKYGLDADCLSTRVLVLISPLMAINNLNLKQFKQLVRLVRDVTASIETARTKALQEREALSQQASSAVAGMSPSPASPTGGVAATGSQRLTADTDGDRDILSRLAKMPGPSSNNSNNGSNSGAQGGAGTNRASAASSVSETMSSGGQSLFDGLMMMTPTPQAEPAGITLPDATRAVSSSDSRAMNTGGDSVLSQAEPAPTSTQAQRTTATAAAAAVAASKPPESNSFPAINWDAPATTTSSSTAPAESKSSARLQHPTQKQKSNASGWATSIFDTPPATATTTTTEPAMAGLAQTTAASSATMGSVFDAHQMTSRPTQQQQQQQQQQSSTGGGLFDFGEMFANTQQQQQQQQRQQQQQQQDDMFAGLWASNTSATSQSKEGSAVKSGGSGSGDLLDLL